MQQFHKIQVSILRTLRRGEGARFTELMRPTGLQSDDFKFHVRKLVKLGLVQKVPEGYELTAAGKEFANNLDEAKGGIQKQPKLSVTLIVPRPDHEGQFLFQQRKRKPYFDFWGSISGPVQWGEEIEQTAERELKKQTGLEAKFTPKTFLRVRDYAADSQELLEDKLFAVLEATDVRGEISNEWRAGVNQWMTLPELESQPKYFTSSLEILEMAAKAQPYHSARKFYSPTDY